MSKLSLESIEKDINERIAAYEGKGLVFPTDDEVTIAWLVSEMKRLNDIITKTDVTEGQCEYMSADGCQHEDYPDDFLIVLCGTNECPLVK